MQQKWTELQVESWGEISHTFLSKTAYLNMTTDNSDLADIYKRPHPTTSNFMFSVTSGAFTQLLSQCI